MKKIDIIINYVNELFANPICELNYSKDYELVIAVMLSAQTTDKRVNMVTKILFSKYPSLPSLSKADLNDVEKIIKPIGTYHIKAKNVIDIAKALCLNKQVVPNDKLYLMTLAGVGNKTANVVLSELFDVPCIAIDTHVFRVSKRLGLANKNDNVKEVEKKLTKIVPKGLQKRFHHQMVMFGRYYCKSIKPLCDNCKLKDICKNQK